MLNLSDRQNIVYKYNIITTSVFSNGTYYTNLTIKIEHPNFKDIINKTPAYCTNISLTLIMNITQTIMRKEQFNRNNHYVLFAKQYLPEFKPIMYKVSKGKRYCTS